MEPMDDSRTSAVGRKRNLEDLQDGSRLSPGEDEQRTKRVKDSETSGELTVEDGTTLHASSPLAAPSSVSAASVLPPTAKPLAGSWNKGVQVGLRTSFGSRSKAQSKAQPKSVRFLSGTNLDAPESTLEEQNSEVHHHQEDQEEGMNTQADSHVSTARTEADLASTHAPGITLEEGLFKEQKSQVRRQDEGTYTEAAEEINAASDTDLASVTDGRRLFIRNLAYETTEVDLNSFFQGYNIVSTFLPKKRRSKKTIVGYAFVDLSTSSEAERAIVDLSGKEILGRKVDFELAAMPKHARQRLESLEAQRTSHSATQRKDTVTHDAATSEEEGEVTSSRNGGTDMLPERSSVDRGDEMNSLPQPLPRTLGHDVGQPFGNAMSSNPEARDAAEDADFSDADANADAADVDDASADEDVETPGLQSQATNATGNNNIPPAPPHELSLKKKMKTMKQEKLLQDIESLNRLTAEAEAMFAHEGPPLSDYSAVEANILSGKTFYAREAVDKKSTYLKKDVEYAIPEILENGNPIDIRRLTMECFAETFRRENQGKHIFAKVFIGALSAYQSKYYSESARSIGNLYGTPHGKTRLKKETAEAVKALKAQRNRSLPNTDVEMTTNAALEVGQPMAESDGGIDIDSEAIDEIQRNLQEKYFPSVQSRQGMYRCLACGETTHMTRQCPSLECVLCGGEHPQNSCAKNRRCSKCRERGHDVAECPEKLSRSEAEGIESDLCGSDAHNEVYCHTIWRTFDPRPEEIRLVRDIPVHCYTCGGTGHYGPECGLYGGHTLRTGGKTWSEDNLAKFLDPSSADRAVSAGIDYSIDRRVSQRLSIKGKASNPINVDESDDEVAFLHEKVSAPKNKGQIKIAGGANLGQPHPRDRYAQEPMRSANAHSGFIPDAGRNGRSHFESARYGRERSFSPPPQFDEKRYVPQDQFRHYQGPQDPPTGPRSNHQPPHGLPARPAGNGRGQGGGRGGGRVVHQSLTLANTKGKSGTELAQERLNKAQKAGQNPPNAGAGGPKKKKKKNKQPGGARGGGGSAAGRG